MKLLKAKLKGFLGIKKGMGLDDLSIDLSDVSGLVAFSGPNGNGKSTLIENMHPFRCLASRNNSLKHHVFLRDSHRDIEFLFGGRHYRSLVKIDSDSDRSEAFLWENGASLVDGKVSNYDAAIAERFGTKELFFNSVFCPQNSKKLSDLTAGELKKLFSEFLRLGRYEAWEKTSKEAITIIGANQTSVEALVKDLVRETDEKDVVLAAMAKAKSDMEEKRRMADYVREKIVPLEAEYKEAAEKASKNAVIEEQISGHKKQIETFIKAIADEKERTDEILNGQRDQYRRLSTEIKGLEATISNRFDVEFAALRLEQVKSDLADARIFYDSADQELSVSIAKELDLAEKIAKKEREKIEIENDGETRKIEKDISETERTAKDIDREIEGLGKDLVVGSLEHDLKSCLAQKSNLSGLIDDPHCRDKKCRFIADAMDSEKRIPELENEIEARRAELLRSAEELNKTKAELEVLIEDLKRKFGEKVHARLSKALAVNEELQELLIRKFDLTSEVGMASTKRLRHRTKIVNLECALSALQPAAAKLPELAVSASKIEGLKTRLFEIESEGRKERGRLELFEKARLEDIASFEALISTLEKRIDLSAVSKADFLRAKIDAMKAEAEKSERETAVLEERIKSLEKELHGKERAEAKLKELRKRKSELVAEASEWIYLRDACGKNGLQALEIDSVAPGISFHANNLLEKTFGPNFSVAFKTKDELTGREILDIVVIDGHGDEIILDNLSGGQKVWILMALRLAMVLIAKEKSGKVFESVFADELDGALDSENAQNFVQMYQAFMQAGGFNDLFFIGHRPECVSMADHVIEFSKSGISIN